MTIKELVEKLQTIANEQGTDEIPVVIRYDEYRRPDTEGDYRDIILVSQKQGFVRLD